jgi:cysteine desulfurase / selenocysteine lyase
MISEDIKLRFPVLANTYEGKPLVYLDSTATTQKPVSVIDAMDLFYRHQYSSVKRGVYRLSESTTQAYEATRIKIQKFINAPECEDIIYTRGTTESINLVASSWGRWQLQPGDEIILSALEHHANIVPWQMIAQEKGALIRVIPCFDNGELDLEAYKQLLCARTKMVAITHVSNALGTVNPIIEICRLARTVGACTLVDAAQSIAHNPIDVQAIDCDFLAFSGHKMYGPTGIGVLYGRSHLLQNMPPYHGGGEMIEKVTFAQTTYAPPPARFEAGTPPIAEVIGLGAAIDFLNEFSFTDLQAHEQMLLTYATQALQDHTTARIIGTAASKGGIISFVLPGIHPHDAGMLLDEDCIAVRTGHHCAQPVMDRFGVSATIRASFGIYNTINDVDVLIKAIQRVEKIFLN